MNYLSKNKTNGKFELYSGLPEFGYELISVIPYAYHLHSMGMLSTTTSGFDTSCLYYFSDDHIEVQGVRSYSNAIDLQNSGFPNANIHQAQLDWSKFLPPPYKEYYFDKKITFEKPSVVICNRYNSEWGGDPVNYLNSETLCKLFELLQDRYQIIYLSTGDFGIEYEDHATFLSHDELLHSTNMDKIITIKDLLSIYNDLTINEIQCRVFAGCEKFISSNGGFGVLCSYFGGENIIFTKKCHELDPEINSFYSWYTKLSKSKITVISEEFELLKIVEHRWLLNKLPVVYAIVSNDSINKMQKCLNDLLNKNRVNDLEAYFYIFVKSVEYLYALKGYPVFGLFYDGNADIEIQLKEYSDNSSVVVYTTKSYEYGDLILHPLVVVIKFVTSISKLKIMLNNILKMKLAGNLFLHKILVFTTIINIEYLRNIVNDFLVRVEFYAIDTNLISNDILLNCAVQKIYRTDSMIYFISSESLLTYDKFFELSGTSEDFTRESVTNRCLYRKLSSFCVLKFPLNLIKRYLLNKRMMFYRYYKELSDLKYNNDLKIKKIL